MKSLAPDGKAFDYMEGKKARGLCMRAYRNQRSGSVFQSTHWTFAMRLAP